MVPYIIGADIGTGSTKAVAIDFSGKALASFQSFYGIQTPKDNFCEQDPDEILQAFIQTIQQTVSKMGSMPAAISLSSAMHGVIVVDENCHPLTNLIIWSDSRSSAIADEFRNSPQAHAIYEHTGTPIHSMSPLCKIIWLRKFMPAVFEKAHKFISIKEYIWHWLFHEFQIDHSLASATGLFNIKTLDWHKESLQLAGITKNHLSHPVSTSYVRKDVQKIAADLLTISTTTPFCIGASDGCLANLGTGSLHKGTAAITIGTSGAVRVASNKPLINYDTMIFNYLLDEQTFICGGPTNNGGNVIQWLQKNFLSFENVNENNYKQLFKLIETIPAGSQGLIFLPYINGERSPVWDEQSCGVFFGIKSYHTQLHFLRAALEGICFGLKEILLTIETESNSIQQINASGGFVQSQSMVQLLSNVTGKKILLQQNEDASAMGAAWLALKALSIDTGHYFSNTDNFIYPQKETQEVYEKNYGIFKTLYSALKSSMHLL